MKELVFFLEEPSMEEMLKGLLPRIDMETRKITFLVFEGKSGDLLVKASIEVRRFLNKKNIVDARMVKAETANFLERYFWEEIKRRPMVLPVVVEV